MNLRADDPFFFFFFCFKLGDQIMACPFFLAEAGVSSACLLACLFPSMWFLGCIQTPPQMNMSMRGSLMVIFIDHHTPVEDWMSGIVTVAMQGLTLLPHVDPVGFKHDINMLIVSPVHGCMSLPSACCGWGHIISAMFGKFQCFVMSQEYNLFISRLYL